MIKLCRYCRLRRGCSCCCWPRTAWSRRKWSWLQHLTPMEMGRESLLIKMGRITNTYLHFFARSFVRSSVCSFDRLFDRLFVQSFVCSFFRSFDRLFDRLFVQSFVCSFVRLFVHSFFRSLFVCLFVFYDLHVHSQQATQKDCFTARSLAHLFVLCLFVRVV